MKIPGGVRKKTMENSRGLAKVLMKLQGGVQFLKMDIFNRGVLSITGIAQYLFANTKILKQKKYLKNSCILIFLILIFNHTR